jgi:phage shock protein A
VEMFKRVSDIIATDLHGLANRFEDPRKVLQQIVCEVEEAIHRVDGQLAVLTTRENVVSRAIEANRIRQQHWHAYVTRAKGESSTGLLRLAIRYQDQYEDIILALVDQQMMLQETIAKLRRQWAALKAKLSEGERKLAISWHSLAVGRGQNNAISDK